MREIPVNINEESRVFGDLKEGRYEMTLESLEKNHKDIYLGIKTREEACVCLHRLFIDDRESLDFLGYKIKIKE